MPNTAQIQTRKMQASANIIPGSYNEEERTLDVEFASEKPVLRYDWENGELYNEVLEMSEKAANLGRVNLGAAVLKDHRHYDLDKVVGITLKGWIEGGKAKATLKLSGTSEHENFRQNVKDGIYRNISFGYNVNEYTRSQKDKTSIPTYRATDWETLEISFVGIPADETVGTRSLAEVKESELKLRSSTTLHTTTLINRMEDEIEATVVPVVEQPTPEQRSAPTSPDASKIADAAVKKERERSAAIRSVVRMAKLEDSFAEDLIDNGSSVDKARELVIAEWAKKDPADGIRSQTPPKMGLDEVEKRRSVRGLALAMRSGHIDTSTLDKTLVQEANKLRALGVLDMARMCLADAGERTEGWSKEEIAKRAITQSTSDFPELLGNVIHQIQLGAYTEIEDTWRQFCSTGSVSDFRDHRAIRSWGLQNLPKVGETEEYKNIPLVDATGEVVRVFKYGGIINLSWEAMVNDELGAFNDLVSDLVRSYQRTIEDEVYATLALNGNRGPLMSDGKALYHVDHKNLITAAAMSGTTLDNIRVQMKAQTDGAGRYIGFKPSILLVNDVNESTAKIYNDAQFDIDVSNKFQVPNKARGLFQKIVSSPRVQPTTAYYAFADPRAEQVLRVSFLDGNQAPVIERHEEYRTDGVNWKIRGVFGVGAVGYRGTQLNPGA